MICLSSAVCLDGGVIKHQFRVCFRTRASLNPSNEILNEVLCVSLSVAYYNAVGGLSIVQSLLYYQYPVSIIQLFSSSFLI